MVKVSNKQRIGRAVTTGMSNTVMVSLFSICVLAGVVYNQHRLMKLSKYGEDHSSKGDSSLSVSHHQVSPPFRRTGPFEMPIKGQAFEIFQPFYDMDDSKKGKVLIAPPQEFMKTFEERISWADTLAMKVPRLKKLTTAEHAAYMYLEMMKSFVSASVFNNAELSVQPKLGVGQAKTKDFNLASRQGGHDWTYAGDTMTGWARLDNIYNLLTDVIKNDIKGDYIETGVWRGGASVFARAVLQVLEPDTTRVSYVCDSFHGLPPGEKNLDNSDKGWDHSGYLEVPSDIVANNFIKYDMLDSNVVFAKGFFNETMPPLSKHINTLSVMRLDVSTQFQAFYLLLTNIFDSDNTLTCNSSSCYNLYRETCMSPPWMCSTIYMTNSALEAMSSWMIGLGSPPRQLFSTSSRSTELIPLSLPLTSLVHIGRKLKM